MLLMFSWFSFKLLYEMKLSKYPTGIGWQLPSNATRDEAQATKFGGNDWAVTLSFPWGFIKLNDLSLTPVALKIFFVRFSFSPFCVKITIPSSYFVSSRFVSFFAKACFSSCKNITKLYSLVRASFIWSVLPFPN